MQHATVPHSARFGIFEVDLRAGELRKGGLRIKLQEQPFQVLGMLLEHAGEVVTREELQKKLWSGATFVDFDHGVNTAISKIRQALGDTAESPRFVETVARHGYRFIAPVENAGGQRGAPADAPGRGLPHKAAVATLAGVAIVAAMVLAHWLTRPSASPPEPTERKLTFNPSEQEVLESAISPDGKYLAYANSAGMHLKLIPTGETRTIPQPEGVVPNRAAWSPNGWFPDASRFVASNWGGAGSPTAWVVSVMGGPPRVLRDQASPWAVSPDGTLIAFGTGHGVEEYGEIWLMDAQGEKPRRLVSGSAEDGYFWAAWSPTGQRIAYGRYHRTPAKEECSIESRDLTGGQPSLIVFDPRLCGTYFHFLWYPSGRFIYTVRVDALLTPDICHALG